jgi:hypothetical protein
MDVAVRRTWRITAEIHAFYEECIRRAEYTSYIVHAADIVEHHPDRSLLRTPEILYRLPLQVIHALFVHAAKIIRIGHGFGKPSYLRGPRFSRRSVSRNKCQ